MDAKVIILILVIIIAIFGAAGYILTHSNTKSQANKSYTMEEVAAHNTSESCFIAFNGEVYDVTNFIPSHPGGDAITERCGTNVDEYSSEHPGGRYDSVKVQATLGNYKIGKLK